MKPETANTLLAAAAQVEAAAAELDRTESKCSHCTATRWTNRDEHQMAVELDAIVRKLRGFARKLSPPTH